MEAAEFEAEDSKLQTSRVRYGGFGFQIPGSGLWEGLVLNAGGRVREISGIRFRVPDFGRVWCYMEAAEFEEEESQLVERVIGCSSFRFRVPSLGLGDECHRFGVKGLVLRVSG